MLKKTVFSVLATTTLATLIATGDAEASSNTYKVNSGDTLWKISLNNNVSVSDLKNWNNLNSDIIYPNQVLKVSGSKGTSSSSSSNTSSSNNSSKPSSNSTSKPSSSTSVYTVKSGDTLGSIASRHNTTVSKLASLNGISNVNFLSIGQKIKVNGKASSNNNSSASKPSTSKPSNNANSGSSSTATGSTYSVKRGDTLSHIAYKHNTSVSKLMSNNNLTSHMIYVGQKLKVNGKATSNNNSSASKPSTSKPTTGASNSKPSTSKPSASGTGVYSSLISAGKSYQGVPYVWGGTSPSGFDCSGFIYYVHNEVGINIPRTNTEGYYSRSFSVSNPIPGDLVFFKNTYKKGISHMGIYLGNGKFLHAGTSQGVTIGNVNDSYWGPKFAGYKRLYEVID